MDGHLAACRQGFWDARSFAAQLWASDPTQPGELVVGIIAHLVRGSTAVGGHLWAGPNLGLWHRGGHTGGGHQGGDKSSRKGGDPVQLAHGLRFREETKKVLELQRAAGLGPQPQVAAKMGTSDKVSSSSSSDNSDNDDKEDCKEDHENDGSDQAWKKKELPGTEATPSAADEGQTWTAYGAARGMDRQKQGGWQTGRWDRALVPTQRGAKASHLLKAWENRKRNRSWTDQEALLRAIQSLLRYAGKSKQFHQRLPMELSLGRAKYSIWASLADVSIELRASVQEILAVVLGQGPTVKVATLAEQHG